ncbi:MAG: DNA-binding transcriptional regulator [Pirellulales bacterium]
MSVDCPRVALMIETSRGYGRSMLRGIMRYARLHGPWSFYVTPGDFEQALPKMSQWGGSGIIARVETPEIAKGILAADVPTVLVGVDPRIVEKVPRLAKLCEISSDSEGAARLAAEHLLARGFRNFAYVGIWDRGWSERRESAFCSAIRTAGFEPSVYPTPRSSKDRGWESEQALLAQWIRELPKPVGIMACNDDRGRGVLEACRSADVRVPEDVAVIGVDDDELFCELSDPPLSSVALNAEHGGYRAAHLLDQLMRKRINTQQRLIVEPTQVVSRRSTEINAIDDRAVGMAIDFIHRNRARNFTVSDVAADVGVSRRNLEVKFRRTTGKTILSEIQRIRLDHAKRMLRDTDLPIPQIAESSGYNSASYLTQVFRKEVGITPAKYRTRFRV